MARSNEAFSEKFSSTFSRGSEEDYSIVCLPCYRDDSATNPASGYCIDCKEHLCPTCLKYHKRATLSKHHKLLDKDAMPTTQPITDTSVHAGFSDNLTTPCSHHQKEIIRLYCHDHDLLLCCKCITLEEHKRCHVDCIPEISDQMIDSMEYKYVAARIDNLLMKCSKIMFKASRDTNRSKESLEAALQEIETHRQKNNERLDDIEKAVKGKHDGIQKENNDKIKTIKTICEDVMKRLNMTIDNMKQLNTSKQGNKLFIEVKQVLEQLPESENSISSISEENIDEYKFVPNQAINAVLQNVKMMGDILTKQQTPQAMSSKSISRTADGVNTCLLVKEIDVQATADRWACFITGMTMLPPDRLILVDRNNISLKMVDVNGGFIISQLSLGTDDEDKPWDITSTTSTLVAVTIPGRQQIKLIGVSDTLSIQDTITTDETCLGICSYKNKLIVTYSSSEKFEILDTKEKVITKVTTDSTGKNIFNDPVHVQANSSTIYVSDLGHREVIMLNWQGEITGRCGDLETPTGLALLDHGSLLVCDLEFYKIYQLSDDCKNSRVIQQDVRRPSAICVDDQQKKLYISRHSYVSKYTNSIVVYNI